MTDDESQRANFNFYRAWSINREGAGGMYDPLFFSNDLKALANTKLENIATYKASPVKGAMGVQQSAMGEYRVYTGRAVKVKRIG